VADHGYNVNQIEQYIRQSVADVTEMHTTMIAASAIRNYCPPSGTS
jgi:hypothetical protein